MPTSAITPFVVALRKTDQEPENWSKAAQTAEGFRAATFEPLVCLLDDSDPDTRAWASRSIGTLASRKIGREPTFRAVSTLTGLIENNSEEAVLEAAIYALGNLGAAAKPAMAPIFDLIYNEKLDRTTCALSALNKIGNWGRLAIPVLKADLMNSDKLVRRRAAGLLACLGYFGRSAIPALLDSFHDETGDVYVKRDARNAIRAIDPSVANLLRTAAIQNQPTTTRQILRASGNYHFARVIRSGKCILGTLFGK